MFKWIKKLFTPKKQVYDPKPVEKEPCWKHIKFKKGCPICRNLNNGA